MDDNGNMAKSIDSPKTVNLTERRAEATEERDLDSQIWSHCCHLNIKEIEFSLANIHYAHVLRKQNTNRARWPEICRIRSIEINQQKTGLVQRYINWMRQLDQRLAEEDIFVESSAKKYMVHPVLGAIPEYDYNNVVVIDLTWKMTDEPNLRICYDDCWYYCE